MVFGRGAGPHSPPIDLNGVADRVAVQDMKFAVMADLAAAATITREGPERSSLTAGIGSPSSSSDRYGQIMTLLKYKMIDLK